LGTILGTFSFTVLAGILASRACATFCFMRVLPRACARH